MTRMQAVLWVALFEFLGALFGGSAVANAIKNITSYPVNPSLLPVLAAGLLAAIIWNFMTKVIKVPSSSTHALVGGIIGALIAGSGGTQFLVWGTPDHIMQSTGIWKVVLSLFLSPLIGFAAGFICLYLLLIFLRNASTHVNKNLKRWQYFATAALAFGHGANDTQKAMGLLVLTLNAGGYMHSPDIPLWIRFLVGGAMVVGIMSLAPGIVKKVGTGIYRLKPIHGLTTELSSAIVVVAGSLTGGPVSASQIIASSVMGIGYAERKKSVHWLVARDMLMAWFLTIPCAGLVAYATYTVLFVWIKQDMLHLVH
jgi:PiT family inorganic phosphate transporter